MKQEMVLKHEFVEFIPDELESGTIYVSIRFATASHLCCCGCGNKVVTPIRPTDWTLIFDGKTVSLEPSIGNWSFPCQSHYYVRKNRIKWAPRWSKEEIERGRTHDRAAKQTYFGDIEAVAEDVSPPPTSKPRKGFWQALKTLWR
jgi:hypothetical protein